MPRLTASHLRKKAEWDVELEDGLTVHCRRIDMVTAYLKNLIPLRLLGALERLKKQSEKLEVNPANLAGVPEEDKAATVELLQRYACACIVDPVFIMPHLNEAGELIEEDGDPNHIPISMLTSDQLLAVWQSSPKKDTLPEVSPRVAEEFRQRSEPQQVPAAVPNGPEVPPAPELVSAGSPLADSGYL